MLKPVQRAGSSKADLKRFPDPVPDRMGIAICQAQADLRHRDAKPLRGFGSAAPKRKLDLVRQRMRAAERRFREERE